MKKIKKYQITFDPNSEMEGVELISFVKNPAIKVKGMIFSEQKEKKFQFKLDEEKMIVVAPAMIPDLDIYRYDENTGEEYYVSFSKEVIFEMMKKFNSQIKEFKFNFDHQQNVAPAYILESWVVEDETFDKSKFYGFEGIPVGTWFISAQVTDKKFWENEIKKEGKFGFSVELFAGLAEEEFQETISESDKEMVDGIINLLIQIEDLENRKKVALNVIKDFEKDNIIYDKSDFLNKIGLKELESDFEETYNDYPQAATDNAKRALKWAEENGWGDCGTAVGKIRANQLANREGISRDTIARMAAFERHRQNSSTPYGEGCGKLMWDAWGGDEGVEWAQRKLKEIDGDFSELTPLQKYRINKKKFVIEPEAGETEEEFIGRCMSKEIGNGYEQDQAYAICKTKWDKS